MFTYAQSRIEWGNDFPPRTISKCFQRDVFEKRYKVWNMGDYISENTSRIVDGILIGWGIK